MIKSSETDAGATAKADQTPVNPPLPQEKALEMSSTVTSAEIEELQKRIQTLEEQVKDKDAKYLYLYADFDNFKKRATKERSDLLKFGWESFAQDLLQIVDNLERALQHLPPHADESWTKGLNMVLDQFKAGLTKQGVQHIESLEKDFDPNLHEAVGQEKSDLPSGKVVREHSRGYTLHGRLLRPARVVISDGQAKSEAKSG